ncbi:hypothetical protein CNEO3_730003 [Clostridium neonatale]|uniref:hypothetical protein n=1 Tax=Clostridium TaxID=1485 RepID=UPI002910815E|nr:hypothetical protein [Clostridium sp.]MDU4477292.1 hypothetical protein [Clostridium sp.]CAI3688270.1 hypothetical protein CNEO3_730003 [Clostridium neonatale]
MLYNCCIILNINNWRIDKSCINKGARNFVIGTGVSSTNAWDLGCCKLFEGSGDKNNNEIKVIA